MINDDIVKQLTILPATDLNYMSVIQKARNNDIEEAIDRMIESGGNHKGRIKACERELRKRGSKS